MNERSPRLSPARGRHVPTVLPDPLEPAHATIRELIIELAQVQYALGRKPSAVEVSALQQRERDAVRELRVRDLAVTCRPRQPLAGA